MFALIEDPTKVESLCYSYKQSAEKLLETWKAPMLVQAVMASMSPSWLLRDFTNNSRVQTEIDFVSKQLRNETSDSGTIAWGDFFEQTTTSCQTESR